MKERKIKVMHVLTDTNIGGAGTLLFNTIFCGDIQRFDYIVVLPEGSRLIERFCTLPCRVLTVNAGKDRSMDLKALAAYVRLLRAERPDILHTHSAFCARLAGKICGVPVCIQTRHCVFPLAAWQKNAVFRFAFRHGSRWLSHRVVAVAEAAKEQLVEMGMDEGQIEVIVNGVPPLRPCTACEIDALRASLGLSREHFVVGMVARLEEYKGQRTVLRAAARCLEKSPDFRFVFVGDGSSLENFRALAHELGIEGSVIFTGFMEDTAPYYALMQVNVNASFGTETSSLALSEGMSVGVPAVASSYGGNPKMIIEGENGLLFPPKDDAALSEALLRLHDDRPLLARLSEGARRHYCERLTADQMVRKLEQLYVSLWEQSKRSKI